jgi:hypothetical protein
MSIHLTVHSEDADLERLFSFLDSVSTESYEKIDLLQRALLWLKAADATRYGFATHLREVSASLVCSDNPLSISPPPASTDPRQQESSCLA